MQPLPSSFYLRPPDAVASGLLGKLVVREHHGELLAGRLVETEAYFGTNDPAAHAFAGETARNSVLFGPPGRAYVYFIYGMHFCLNASCERAGDGAGVLFRALEPVAGMGTMARLRGLGGAGEISQKTLRLLCSGPGRLCQALAVTRDGCNGLDLTSPRSPLRIVDDGAPAPEIEVTPRIGISKAAELPARYIVRGSPFLSGR